MLFSNGRWIVPVATWLCPIFFLRFLRMQRPARAFFILALVSATFNSVMWWKIMPTPAANYFTVTTVFLQLYTLCFLADRLLASRIKSFFSTFIFPAAWCSVEYLTSFIPAKASNMTLAYTQSHNLFLMQLASVTGIWGISFLITWFAAVVNWAWAQNFEWRKIRRGAIAYASVAVIIFLFGVIRVNFYQPSSQSVLTASIVQARNVNKELTSCTWTDAKAISSYSANDENNLLEKTEQAANAGAKIILWQEGAGWLPKKEEENFIGRAAALAEEKKVYLLMTLWSVPEDFPKHRVENKLLIIGPDGKMQASYVKSNPVPVEPIVKGKGVIPIVQTEYGKIATAICFDGDFQNFIRQAGKSKADVMFLPANDWKEIDPLHTYQAIARAIENGFSLVHPTGQGLSVATDNRGRIISSMDFFTTNEQIMYASVPIENSFTIYTQLGDFFGWICIAFFLASLGWSIFKKYSIRMRPKDNESIDKLKTSLQ